MPACCISPGLAEMFAALVVLIIVVNAIVLTIGTLKPSEALRNIVVAICLLLALAALVGILLNLWEYLSILEKIGVSVIGAVLGFQQISRLT